MGREWPGEEPEEGGVVRLQVSTDVRKFVALECEENCRKIVTRQIGAELAGEMEGNRNNPGEKREAAQGAGWWARHMQRVRLCQAA
jgi:hypothetical protein